MAASMSTKRIRREILDLTKEDLGDIVLTPTDKSIYEWKGSIPGPSGSPYAGGVFHLAINLPNDYPFSAPKVIFTTPIYHPNVSPNGQICVDVLKNQWSPALSLYKVMLSLSSLLTDPNPNDPLVPSIAQEYLKNRPAFDRKARDWTTKHATPGKGKPQPQAKPNNNNPRASTADMDTQQMSPSNSGFLSSIISFTTSRLQGGMGPITNQVAPLLGGSHRSARNPRPVPASTNSQTRPSAPQPTRRPPVVNDEIIILDDSDDEVEQTSRTNQTAGRKRKREEESRSGHDTGPSRPRRRRNPASFADEDIIIIDDD